MADEGSALAFSEFAVSSASNSDWGRIRRRNECERRLVVSAIVIGENRRYQLINLNEASMSDMGICRYLFEKQSEHEESETQSIYDQ
jgi:hypothetical protein